MAFLAAGLVKGAQYVRREARKNRERNALITAPGHVLADEHQLSIERDWWGESRDTATVPSSREASPSERQHTRPLTLSDDENENDHHSFSSTSTQALPVVADLRVVVVSGGDRNSKSVQGSYAEKLESRDAQRSDTGRKLVPRRQQAAPEGSFSAALQSGTQTRAFSSRLPSSTANYAPADIPSTTSSATSRRWVPAKPRAAAPRRSGRPSTAAAAVSGSFAEARKRNENANARPKAANVRQEQQETRAVAGSFLEAKNEGRSWNEFISSVEQDSQRASHHKTPSR